MKPRPAFGRFATSMFGAVALLTATRSASAEDEVRRDVRQECLDEAVEGQRFMSNRRLLDARTSLWRCAQAGCPGVVQRDCIGWLGEIEAAIPTIVVVVKAESGQDIVDAQLWVDDAKVHDAIEGKALPLNPGVHVVRVRDRSGTLVEQTIIARENEKGRMVTFTLANGPPAERSQNGSPTPTLTYVLGGVGLAATGAFSYFGIKGLGERASRCDADHGCGEDAYDSIQTAFTISSIAGVVAVTAFAAAIWTYLARPAIGAASRATARY